MSYIYIFVVVVVILESYQLLVKVVFIVCFVQVKVSLIIFVFDFELYNQFVVFMMEDLCVVMYEEIENFFKMLGEKVDYLIE